MKTVADFILGDPKSLQMVTAVMKLKMPTPWKESHDQPAAAAAKSLQSCPIQRPHGLQPTRLLHPWDSPGESTGLGHHCLLQFPHLFAMK